jgi:mycofactocin system glycosyltransferase
VSAAGPPRDGLPPTFGLRLDPATLVEDGGHVLLGGDPFQVVRLDAGHAAAVAGWQSGTPIGRAPGHRRLARALAAVNLAQPVPIGGPGAPPVSVVVPVRDRPAQLGRLLAALDDTPAVTEVIVVDDASADPGATARVTAQAGARLVRRAVRGGAAAARNDGASAAGSPVVAFVDSDCVPRPGWLAPALAHLVDPGVAVAAPRIVAHQPPPAGSPVAAYEAARSPLDRGPIPASVKPGGRVPFLPGAALVTRSAVLGRGFDTTLTGGEDVDLVWRLVDQGWVVRYDPNGLVGHEHRTDARAWLRRRVYYGRTAAPLAARHPGRARPLAVSPWTSAAWAAAAVGRPATGAAITGTAVTLLARELTGLVAEPWRTAAILAGGGTLRSGWAVADACTRSWWPLSLAAAALVPRLRPALAAAALVPALLDWRRSGAQLGPLAWTGLRLLDDAAYGWGVWAGCLLERNPDPLLPSPGWRLDVITGDELVRRYGEGRARV